MENTFEPKIVAFVCNWCTYAGADLTGTSRIKYATNVRIVRFPCTGRIDYNLLLKAFAQGADGVIVSGCIQTTAIIRRGIFMRADAGSCSNR